MKMPTDYQNWSTKDLKQTFNYYGFMYDLGDVDHEAIEEIRLIGDELNKRNEL